MTSKMTNATRIVGLARVLQCRVELIGLVSHALGTIRASHLAPGTELKVKGPAAAVLLDAGDLEILLTAALREIQSMTSDLYGARATAPNGTIAALQYDALRSAWPAAREAYHFSEQEEADWAEGMDVHWNQMTPAEQQTINAELLK